MPVTDHIRNKLSQVPHRPGVYLHKDRFGTVVYVGKARDLRKRVSQYFHPSRRMGWDLKFNALVDAIHDFDWHEVKSEAEALLLEGKLIKDFKPRFNIDFRDDKRFLLLKVNLNDPIPRFTLTRFRKDDGSQYFGPFAHSGSLRRTMIMLRRKFHLRGCRPLTPTEVDYKHCLFANVKNCTAPCIGNVTRDEYLAQVRAGCEFLEGHTGELRAEIEAEMKKAAAALEFEKAAQLRDALEDMKRTTAQTEKFERVPYKLPVAINPEADMRELGRILGLAVSPSRIEGFDISNISGTFMVASLVSFWCGRPDRSNYRRFKMKSVTAQNDFACMAETIRRRYSRLQREVEGRPELPAETDEPKDIDVGAGESSELQAPWVPKPDRKASFPDLILIDGGKGQLNAACEELAALGLSHIPIIGLAKEYEEIYRPGEPEPLRLGLDNPALKLLQRVRDESHRFANTYNAQLRLKKISESILDEFPGIGGARKQALLKRFGSVERIRRASLEQIGEVSGFGGETAVRLKAFLEARESVKVSS
ncbi:MAG TPA: excinuclease ABC subunit UvrC [Candidatus Limnocylindria bacterium]|jgi:excinuclease ABC subunit C|nr:excinuclease ABC subunit UvrC [Candidatus Limnocylindria bacterium]